MSKEKTVVITSAVRTAIGSLGGTLKNVPAYKLGSTVISNAIKKSNLGFSIIFLGLSASGLGLIGSGSMYPEVLRKHIKCRWLR